MLKNKEKLVKLSIVAAIATLFVYIWLEQGSSRNRTAQTLSKVEKVLKEKSREGEEAILDLEAELESPSEKDLAHQGDASKRGRLSESETRILLTSNPFKILEKDPVVKPQKTKAQPLPRNRPIQKEKPKLRLLGTIYGKVLSWAVILDLEAKKEGFYEPGDLINESTKLLSVERSAATILFNGRELRLKIDWKDNEQVLSTARPMKKRIPLRRHGNRRGIFNKTSSKPADSTVTVSKSELDKNFKNLSQLLTQMRVQPFFEKGKPAGFLISSVRRGSFVERLGARSGDIIKEVNGQKVDSVQKAFKLYNAFKNNNSVKITITRKGRPHTLNFAMK